jgi:hypothetical protein
LLGPHCTEKVHEKTVEELQLEEFLFGKDIISLPKKHEEDDEVEVRQAVCASLIAATQAEISYLCAVHN